jgi:hypothetical protein
MFCGVRSKPERKALCFADCYDSLVMENKVMNHSVSGIEKWKNPVG